MDEKRVVNVSLSFPPLFSFSSVFCTREVRYSPLFLLFSSSFLCLSPFLPIFPSAVRVFCPSPSPKRPLPDGNPQAKHHSKLSSGGVHTRSQRRKPPLCSSFPFGFSDTEKKQLLPLLGRRLVFHLYAPVSPFCGRVSKGDQEKARERKSETCLVDMGTWSDRFVPSEATQLAAVIPFVIPSVLGVSVSLQLLVVS